MPYSVGDFGNPHSRTHAYGWDSEAAMETARKVGHECLLNCYSNIGSFVLKHLLLKSFWRATD